MDQEKSKKWWLDHPILFEFVKALITAIVGGAIGYNINIHDAVTYNNINSYIKSELVIPGLMDKEILSLENPFEQIQKIASTMSEQKTNYDKSLNEISGENEELKAKLEELEGQKLAELSSPELNILGESKDTTLKDYMATIDGHTYYLEGFLNTFLPDEISYNEEIIQYGKDVPEKVNVVSENLIYDPCKFEIYNGTYFTMGHQEYSNGIVSEEYGSGSFSIDCNREYSSLSFIPGHIDDSGSYERTLTISYLGDDGTYKEIKTIDMNIEMSMEQVILPIYNTKTVRITSTSSADTQYGLADIYLIK